LDFRGRALLAWLILLYRWTYRNTIRIIDPLGRGQKPPVERVLEGQALVRSWIFGGQSLSAWLILLLKCTLSNIMCIIDPLDGGQMPSIEMVLEGRHFLVIRFSGAGTMDMAHIIVEMHYQ